jgi:ribosomal protein L31
MEEFKEFRCLRCNGRLGEPEFCTKHGDISPTPLCQACANCLCDSASYVERFYDMVLTIAPNILNELSGRVSLEGRLLKLFQTVAVPVDTVQDLRDLFSPNQINELLRFVINEDMRKYPSQAKKLGILPAKINFSEMELSVFRSQALYPVCVFDFQGTAPKVVMLAGTQYAIRSIPKLGLARDTVFFLGIDSSEHLELLAQHYEVERDYTRTLKILRAWVDKLSPECVRFYKDQSSPECLIGKKWLKPDGFRTGERFPGIDKTKDAFIDSNQFAYGFAKENDRWTTMTVSPLRLSTDAVWSTCHPIWTDMTRVVERASGIVLIHTMRNDAAVVRDFVEDRLSRNFDISDFDSWGLNFYEGNLVIATDEQARKTPGDLLGLSRSVTILFFYTGMYPSKHFPVELRREFEQSVAGHYLFTLFRPLCVCADGGSSHSLQLANAEIMPAVFSEPSGIVKRPDKPPSICDKCHGSGYREKYLLIAPYQTLAPDADGNEPSIDRDFISDFMKLDILDFWYATRLFGSNLKHKSVALRANHP